MGKNHKHDEKYHLPKEKGNTSMRQKVMEKTIEMRNEIETTKDCHHTLVKLNVFPINNMLFQGEH
jgi:hypothetical protein